MFSGALLFSENPMEDESDALFAPAKAANAANTTSSDIAIEVNVTAYLDFTYLKCFHLSLSHTIYHITQ